MALLRNINIFVDMYITHANVKKIGVKVEIDVDLLDIKEPYTRNQQELTDLS